MGIASLEDKIVQQAVVTVLNAIYEEDFLGFSYGFRPGRSQHDALDALTVALNSQKVNWILDADITSFFDEIDHEWMLMFLGYRIADRRLLGHICKWLKAGVIEDGRRVAATKGTPQGAVISSLLANIYLYYVLDLWARQWRERHARGDVIVVRYADDSVVRYADDSVVGLSVSQRPDRPRAARDGRGSTAPRAPAFGLLPLSRQPCRGTVVPPPLAGRASRPRADLAAGCLDHRWRPRLAPGH